VTVELLADATLITGLVGCVLAFGVGFVPTVKRSSLTDVLALTAGALLAAFLVGVVILIRLS
jgi:VanZ family protein